MKTKHFPSLDLCKKLTEIGFPTTFQHIWDSWWTVIWCWEIPEWMYVSPSVMEMLDVMPKWITTERPNHLSIVSDWAGWIIRYASFIFAVKNIENESLPNALAEMILWLHENNYISFNK